jgi:hypothetical protein
MKKGVDANFESNNDLKKDMKSILSNIKSHRNYDNDRSTSTQIIGNESEVMQENV